MSGVEVNIEKIKELQKEEVKDYILEEISNFNKVKHIKQYLRLVIKGLETDISNTISEFNTYRSKERIKTLEITKNNIYKIKVIKKIYSEYKGIKDKKILKTEQNIEEVKMLKNDLDSYDLSCVINKFKEIILKADINVTNQELNDYSLYIQNKILENINNFSKEDIVLILDSLKYRISTYEKDSVEKILLKNIQRDFKYLVKIVDVNNKIKTKEESYFEIINYYIQNENIYLLQELIRRKPEICNLKVENKHILFYILDLYLSNLILMFNDKKGKYINPHYLEQLYLTFTRSVNFRMKNEEKLEIESKLEEISNYVDNTLVKEKRKRYALNEIKEMHPNNFYKKVDKTNDISVEEDYMVYTMQCIVNHCSDHASRIENNGVIPENAVVVGNRAYSLKKQNDKIILKIHTLNCSSFIPRDSYMNRYFIQCICNDCLVDKFVKRAFDFRENEDYFTMTYNLEFNISGKFNNLKVTRNLIHIDKIYNTFYKKDEFVEEFEELYSKSICKNGGVYYLDDIFKKNEHFENILNNAYIKFIKDNRLPFIYRGYTKITDDEFNNDRNFLVQPLSSLSKSESTELLDILTNHIDKYHYSVYPIPNPNYDLNLLDNFNYLGVENLRMLNELYFNSHRVNKMEIEKRKKLYLAEYDKMVEYFNKHIDYIDNEKIKKYRGKMLIRRKLGGYYGRF